VVGTHRPVQERQVFRAQAERVCVDVLVTLDGVVADTAPLPRGARQPRAAANAPPAGTRSVLPPDIPQYFPPIREAGPAGAALLYEPRIYAAATVRFADQKLGINERCEAALVAPLPDRLQKVAWDEAVATDLVAGDLETEPADGATFGDLPPAATRPKSYDAWSEDLLKWLLLGQQLEVLRRPTRPD
jgi:hypothetical protein